MKLPSSPPIYLDHHATTPVDSRVAAIVSFTMTSAFGNANSVEHWYGDSAASLIDDARIEVAELVGAESEGVNFTSGSTESIRTAIAHAVAACPHSPLRVAVSTVEHRAVLDALSNHERKNELVTKWIPVDIRGRLNISALETACRDGVDLVCVMAANNEVGTIYPIQDIVRIANLAGAKTLVDATQAVGRIPLNLQDWGVTYMTVSAHKIYGPKGVGALVVQPELIVQCPEAPYSGIGHGTPNVPGIAGLGEACRLRRLETLVDEPRMADQRDRLEAFLVSEIDGIVINGDRECRLTNNLNVSIAGVPNDAVIARLRPFVALSSGSACSSAAQEPSHVLSAMGLSEALIDGALRISTGKFTTDEEIDRAGVHIVQSIQATRDAMKRPSKDISSVLSTES